MNALNLWEQRRQRLAAISPTRFERSVAVVVRKLRARAVFRECTRVLALSRAACARGDKAAIEAMHAAFVQFCAENGN